MNFFVSNTMAGLCFDFYVYSVSAVAYLSFVITFAASLSLKIRKLSHKVNCFEMLIKATQSFARGGKQLRRRHWGTTNLNSL